MTALKNYLRIDLDDEDELLEVMLASATRRLEQEINQKFISQVWEIYFDDFPWSSVRGEDCWWDGVREGPITSLRNYTCPITLPFGPLITLDSIKAINESGTETTVPTSNYTVDKLSARPRIALNTGAVWPTVILRPLNGVVIRGSFGLSADAAGVPNEIKLAIKQFVAMMYEHRGDELPQIPAEVLLYLEPYRYKRL